MFGNMLFSKEVYTFSRYSHITSHYNSHETMLSFIKVSTRGATFGIINLILFTYDIGRSNLETIPQQLFAERNNKIVIGTKYQHCN